MPTNQPVDRVVRIEEVPWIEAPGHHGALSKLLINPTTARRSFTTFASRRTSPKGTSKCTRTREPSTSTNILGGKGVMTLGDRTFVVEPHTAIFIPPGLAHAIDNTGLENLVFIVVNVPADELPRVDTRI